MADPSGRDNLDDFQALVAGHQAGIYRLAYRLAGNHEDAEDLVQESLLEAFLAFRRFRVGTHFDLWVRRIMVRTFIDMFRRRKRVRALSLEELGLREQEPADASGDPQERLGKADWSEPVQAALLALSPEFRAAVILCDGEGLSYEEASRALRCPVGTVRSRLHRAREQLRVWLAPIRKEREGGPEAEGGGGDGA